MRLTQAIDRLQTLCRNGDAQALLQEMFAEEATVCGEGAPGITAGAELLPALTEMLKITPRLSIRSVRTEELSATSAITWLEWTSPPADPAAGGVIEFRSLAAWRRKGDHWVIVADMYCMGTFGDAQPQPEQD